MGLKFYHLKVRVFSLIELDQFCDYKIQPISISYSKIDGMPVEKNLDLFAWFGNMDLVSMLGNFLTGSK